MWFKNKNFTKKMTILIFSAVILLCLNLVGCGHKDNPTAENNSDDNGIPTLFRNKSGNISYTIRTIVQNESFELYIYVPEDFPVNITNFEFWVDNVLVGERTSVEKPLRHLSIPWETKSNAKILLYNNEELVADCKIDPTVETGFLEFEIE